MSVTAEAMVIGTVTDYGDQALLLEFDSTAEVLAWNDVLRDADLPGGVDLFPASRTVLIKLNGPRYQGMARQQLSKLRLAPDAVREAGAPVEGRVDVVIDVVYDGADLDEVAKLTGLSRRDVIAAHTTTPWRGGFAGFAPGFAYLGGGDERLHGPPRPGPPTKGPLRPARLGG